MPPQPQPPVITTRRPRSCRTLDAYTSLVLVWVVGIGGTWGYELGRCSGEFWEAALVNQYYAGHYGRAIRSAAVAGAGALNGLSRACTPQVTRVAAVLPGAWVHLAEYSERFRQVVLVERRKASGLVVTETAG